MDGVSVAFLLYPATVIPNSAGPDCPVIRLNSVSACRQVEFYGILTNSVMFVFKQQLSAHPYGNGSFG